jgi:alpha-tubulin suppressor-like RCC1 family protein
MTEQTGRNHAACTRPATSRAVARGAVAAALAVASLAAGAAATAASADASPSARAAATGGTLRAWGNNVTGQLGNGTETSSDTPVKVKLPAGTKITSVRAGCNHSVALTTKGHVLAWGLNNHGQLGDGSTTDTDTPVRVKFAAGTKITSVRAGCFFSMALTTKDHVLTWGAGAQGQLGDGSNSGTDTPVRVKLPAGTKAKSISAGSVHALAITTKGHLYAWGYNGDGELGNGTTNDSDKPVKARLPAGTKVKIVSAGGNHTLALSRARQLYAWGYNGDGELGDGTTTSRDTPEAVDFLFRGTSPGAITSLAAGCFHSLALTTKGVILGWGLGTSGQLGNASTTSSKLPVGAMLPAGTHVKSISAGCDDSYARAAKGHVFAWGDNANGQLGNGTTTNSDVPVRVALAASQKAIAIGSGPVANHSFAIVRKRS